MRDFRVFWGSGGGEHNAPGILVFFAPSVLLGLTPGFVSREVMVVMLPGIAIASPHHASRAEDMHGELETCAAYRPSAQPEPSVVCALYTTRAHQLVLQDARVTSNFYFTVNDGLFRPGILFQGSRRELASTTRCATSKRFPRRPHSHPPFARIISKHRQQDGRMLPLS